MSSDVRLPRMVAEIDMIASLIKRLVPSLANFLKRSIVVCALALDSHIMFIFRRIYSRFRRIYLDLSELKTSSCFLSMAKLCDGIPERVNKFLLEC